MNFRRLAIAVVTLALLPLAGCGGETAAVTPVAPRADAPKITAGEPIPAPKGEVILRITGVPKGNVKRKKPVVALDLATLVDLPQITGTVREPFLKRDVAYEGIPVDDLLRVAGVPDSATSVYMHALDDYHVTFEREDLVSAKAVLATSIDGKAIPMEEGGPIRVIFLGSNDIARNTDRWIWSVDSMRIRD